VSKQCKEWLNISEIANLLNCSRPTIYKKIYTIDTDILQPLQHKEKGITYYNYKIIDILKDDSKLNDPPVENNQAAADKIDYKDEYIESLKSDIEFLRSQVKELNIRLAVEQELHQNTQVLFKQQIPQDVKQLEAHFKEIDGFIDTWQQDHQQEQEKKTSFFKKIFNR
jgi:hypothetical protein